MTLLAERIRVEDLADKVFERALDCVKLPHYTGILLLQSAVHLAHRSRDETRREKVRSLLLPFARGERDFQSNFPLYNCGGNAGALALRLGWLPEAGPAVARYSEWFLDSAPRDSQGLVVMPGDGPKRKLWIDAAWAVAPFACHAGVALGNTRLIDEAAHQILGMVKVLRDPSCGLLHQCRGFNGPERLSEDHWSRGNGWAALALAELLQGLPEEHPRRAEIENALGDLLNASLAVQDAEGLWRQEMTDKNAWVETSGSAMLLFALGAALERGLIGPAALDSHRRGLRGLLGYISLDGSVHQTCIGCLCPGQGSQADYVARPHAANDPHAFGAVILAMAQAIGCGLESL